MRMLRGSLYWGLCPQTPGIYRFFLARMDSIGFHSGDRECLSPAFPAAEPVARVASLRCPIPSGSGRLIINHVVRGFHENAANGKNPLNLVSHVWGSPHDFGTYLFLPSIDALLEFKVESGILPAEF